MKKNIILAIVGVILMIGAVSCQQGEPWVEGAPESWVGKCWVDASSDTMYKFAADGTVTKKYTFSNAFTHHSWDIVSYKSNEVTIMYNENATLFDDGETDTYYWTLNGTRIRMYSVTDLGWLGSYETTWYVFDETTDPTANNQ